MKTQKLMPIMMILLLAFSIATVSAASVTTSIFFDETTDYSYTITDGDQVGVVISADSVFEDSMTITLELLDSTGNLVNTLLEVETTFDSYSNHITVGKLSYETAGTYTIRSTVVAASGDADTDELTLVVNPVPTDNNIPVITPIPNTDVNEGEEYLYQVVATDADASDVLTYSLTQNPDWLSIGSSTGLIAGTAPFLDSDYNYAVTVQVSDGKSNVSDTYVITVNNVANSNDPPVINSEPITKVNENAAYNYQVDATDPNGDALTYSLSEDSPSWLSISSSGLVTGTAPVVSADTIYDVTVIVSDGQANATQKYDLTVVNVPVPGNNAPVIESSPDTSVDENTIYTYQVEATDADATDVLTYSLSEAPSWLSIDSTTGLITGIAPSVSSDTSFNITVSVTDGTDSDSQEYILVVEDTSTSRGRSSASSKGGGLHRVTDSFYEQQYFDQFETTPIVLEEEADTQAKESRLGGFLTWLFVLTVVLAILVVIMALNRYQ